ncbi:MAG: hypothetical protein QOE69_1061 [Thermoleophilaceae bacterium]|jgi:hypothetical protein|nr:hypothetical protein [Thermoleophilaceae bacterium]
MPTVLAVRQVETLREYMEQIEELMAPRLPLWYRGVGSATHQLIPSLYRHASITGAAELMNLEARILQRFRERSIPYQPIPVEKDWELLFLMQHFGVPTRLLDWTENPYIGLFFALTGAKIDYDTGIADGPAAVWVLGPELWNQHTLSDISYDGGVLSIGSDPLKSYTPLGDPQYMRVAPAAMYGLHNSPRIVAQRGVFTIFGKEAASLEDLFAANDYPSEVLVKFEFPPEKIADLRESLFAIGVTDSVVYPDLAGLALELKRYFGFRV